MDDSARREVDQRHVHRLHRLSGWPAIPGFGAAWPPDKIAYGRVAIMISVRQRVRRFLLQQRLVSTASNASDSCVLICACCAGGKASMMRSIVLGALEVWRVPKTKCPVSAAVKAN